LKGCLNEVAMYLKINLALIALSVPLSFLLPQSLAFENGVIENLQVAVLIFSAALNLKWSLKAENFSAKWFHRFCAALIFLFALRELSYGRVFFQTGILATGEPTFIMMKDFPYCRQIYIFLTIYILALVIMLLKFIPLKKMLFTKKPVAALIVMSVAILFSQIGEHGFFAGGEFMEEFNELIAYMTFPKICSYYREFFKQDTN